MKNLLENPVLDFINTLCNFIVLNLVFLITCIPIFTIGTALSSLYCIVLKEARGEYGYLTRTYLNEFKKNFKAGTSAFLILFVTGALLLFNLVFWHAMGTILTSVVSGLIFVACILWFFIFTYTFPLIARFENTTIQTLKNAFYFTMSHVKATLALLLIDIFVFCLCFFLAPMKLIMVLFGFAFVAYCQSFVFNKIFEPYEK